MRRRGYDAERALVRKLRSLGFKAVRVPSSAPSSEPLPDLFGTLNEGVLAVEVKASSGDKIYFSSSQVKKLFEFLEMFDLYREKVALLVGKFPYRWIFKRVEKVDNYVLRRDEKSNIQLEEIFKG
ncbi:MAG: endonuclease [Candidatus Bathyarchaeota archaeon B63]|nr:MAG: endonuclease [Candidatus Bathyarchaeota archaeon B63]